MNIAALKAELDSGHPDSGAYSANAETAAADAVPQIGVVGMIRPAGRYLGIVVGNNSGTATATTADECAIRVTGQHLQLQD